MTKAKLFTTGGSQAVRLPAEFRFEGSEVDIRRDPVTGSANWWRWKSKKPGAERRRTIASDVSSCAAVPMVSTPPSDIA